MPIVGRFADSLSTGEHGRLILCQGECKIAQGHRQPHALCLDEGFLKRPEAKKHGRQNKIEGYLEPEQNVVVVEDLISTGKSSLNAVKALNDAQANVKGMVAIFSYGFEFATQNFKNSNVELTTLSDYNHLLEQAIETKYITQNNLKTLESWCKNPDKWS